MKYRDLFFFLKGKIIYVRKKKTQFVPRIFFLGKKKASKNPSSKKIFSLYVILNCCVIF